MLTAAAVLLAVALVAALVWRGVEDDSDAPVSVDTRTPAETVAPLPPARGDTAPLVPSPDVQLAPTGPVADGDRIELSVPAGTVADWLNGWPVLCSSVTDGSTVTTSCDHTAEIVPPGYGGVSASAGRDRRQVVVRRQVLTPLGRRDCGEDAVSCHLVLAGPDGTPLVSPRLRVDGPAPDPAERPGLDVAAGATSTQFVVTPHGLRPASAGVDSASAGTGVGAAGYSLSVCAFGDGDPAVDPWGGSWGEPPSAWTERPGLGVDCDTLGPISAPVDPEDPNRPFTVTVDRELFGYSGWSDCRQQRCYVALTPHTASGEALGPALAALLVVPPTAAFEPRPTLEIAEPAPYRPDQTVTVTVSHLPDTVSGMLGICRRDAPSACGYGFATTGAGSRTVTMVLASTVLQDCGAPAGCTPVNAVADCGLDGCAVIVGGTGEGLAPPAALLLPVEPTPDP